MKLEVLCADRIVKKAWNTTVLNRLDISLYKGEILGIIGLVGSGLTTLANVLSGVTSYDGGIIWVNEHETHFNNVAQAQEEGIFCIRNVTTLFSGISILENFCLSDGKTSRWVHYSTKEDEEKIADIFSMLSIPFSHNEEISRLSLFQKHMVEIARVFFCEGRIIILDDVLRLYTESELSQFISFLKIAINNGMSIIWIDSNPERLLPIADRLIVVKAGKTVGLFEKKDFSIANIRKILTGQAYSFHENKDTVKAGEVLLEASNIYTENLTDVSFQVHKGEAIGLIDTEDRTCTDIIAMLRGNSSIKSGKLTLDGKQLVMTKGRQAMVKQGFGFIEYYRDTLFPRLTVGHNLTIACLPMLERGLGISEHLEKFAIEEYANKLGIPLDVLDKCIKDTNSVIQLKIAMYKWILAKAKIIVMDNVLSGTDVVMYDEIFSFINVAKRNGMGIIYTAPNDLDYYKICDSLFLLEKGHISKKKL